MKTAAALVCSFIAFFGAHAAAGTAMRAVETVRFDWDGDGKADTFEFKLPGDWNDPGDYLELDLTFGDKRTCKISLDAGSANPEGVISSLVTSRYVSFFADKLANHPLMMLRNWEGGSSPDSVILYSLESGKCPEQIWATTLLIKYAQTLSDGRTRWTGLAGGEELDSQTKTYSPDLVYLVVKNKDGKLGVALDEAASKEANERNNYPWVGAAAPSSKVVFFPKPRVIDQKDVERVRTAIDSLKL